MNPTAVFGMVMMIPGKNPFRPSMSNVHPMRTAVPIEKTTNAATAATYDAIARGAKRRAGDASAAAVTTDGSDRTPIRSHLAHNPNQEDRAKGRDEQRSDEARRADADEAQDEPSD